METEFIVWMVYAGILGGCLGVKYNPLMWQFWAWDIPLLIVGRIIIIAIFKSMGA